MSAANQISVIGIADDRLELLTPEAQKALVAAEVVVGGRRHLQLWRAWLDKTSQGTLTVFPETIEIPSDAEKVAAHVRRVGIENNKRCCVLASGDPGFFGILRALINLIDRKKISVYPAVSSVGAAFSKVSLPWDDAAVISLQGRPIAEVVGAIRMARTCAVLTTPEVPPELLGQALIEAQIAADFVAVCSRLGTANEVIEETSLNALADGRFDPLSVVILAGPGGLPLAGWDSAGGANAGFGLPQSAYAHRTGMITKAEVRAVALAKLALPIGGVVWDVGAGNGSMGIECALIAPGLQVFAIEHSHETASRISANAHAQGANVHVIEGHAPEAFMGLPAPDRVFVGGGGLVVLESVLDQLRPGGRVVATYSAMDRAAAAAELLGGVVEVGISRGERLPSGGWRLVARNPVFVVYGPGADTATDSGDLTTSP